MKAGSSLKIRVASDGDWTNIYQLIEDNMLQMQLELNLDWKRDSIVSHYQSKSVLVAELGQQVVGFIAFHLSENVLYIDSLQVVKTLQNRLLGYRLIKAMLGYLSAKQDIVSIRCCVFENNPAQKQYFAAGFKQLQRKDGILTLEADLESLLSKLGLIYIVTQFTQTTTADTPTAI